MLQKALYNSKLVTNEFNAEITYDDLPYVIADTNQMVKVFQNLISNAIKFKKPNFPPRIHISFINIKMATKMFFVLKIIE